jgi:hypothetical protein
MAFVIKKKDTFFWPVKVKAPIDGGKYEEQEIQVEYRRLKMSEVNKLQTQDGVSFCKSIIAGWKDVRSEDGTDVPFTDTALEALLDQYGFANQIARQYFEAMAGAAEKN